MRLVALLALALVFGCDSKSDTDTVADTGDTTGLTTIGCGEDGDCDGYTPAQGDCVDTDATLNPGAVEICDGTDQDCDGDVDEDAADAPFWYADTDGDGFGDAATALPSCDAPAGYIADATDCDDTSPDAHPGAIEVCDGLDDDCEGTIDEGAVDAATWYADADHDGFGDATLPTTSCEAPLATVADATDCDDHNHGVHPGADEVCDGIDDNCDTVVDIDAIDIPTWYADADGDGWGDPATGTIVCDAPPGTVSDGSDCDDADATISPDAIELCDTIDNDCDGATDEEDAADPTTWYADTDGDGYGDATAAIEACNAPIGYVPTPTDCDDANPLASPATVETCDGIDDDCDAFVDEDDAADAPIWYADLDGDGAGDPAVATRSCSQPAGYVASGVDCDDSDNAVSPAAVEICDGADDDCDGVTDEGDASDALTWYADVDADGFGDATAATTACTQPAGYVSDATDCDDASATVSPAGVEVCDGVDEDCDGDVDEDATDATAWYTDTDGDGFGDASTPTLSCTAPSGTIATGGDCDDTDSAINPTAAETCDGQDDDCNGAIDDVAPVDETTTYADADGDGHGDADYPSTGCGVPAGYVTSSDDCDDTDAAVNPDATEVCGNLVDDDCEGTIDTDCPTYVSHCGTISASETWTSDDIHLVTCDVSVGGATSPILTIEDGTTVVFSSHAGLSVGTSNLGRLVVNGTTAGVTFTSGVSSPAAGDWDGITIGSHNRGTTITGATIEYAGTNGYGALYLNNSSNSIGTVTVADSIVRDSSKSGIYLGSNSEIDLSGTTVSDNAEYGVYLSSAADLATTDGPTFTGNTLTSNGLYPIVLPAAYVGQLDASSTFSGNIYDFVDVTGGTITTTATWQDLAVPYRITGDTSVAGSGAPVLTVADGVTMAFEPGKGLTVGGSSYGGLVVDGATAGVTFTSATETPAPGDWDGVTIGSYARGVTITGATIEYGGNNGDGDLVVTNSDRFVQIPVIRDSLVRESSHDGIAVTSSSTVSITDTIVRDNAGYGVNVDSTSNLDGAFAGNTVTGNAYPLNLPANDVDLLSATSSYAGNAEDLVRVTGDTIDHEATWPLLDADYLVAGDIAVGDTIGEPLLTLSDGTALYFDPSTGISVGSSEAGALAIEGTTLGVLLTSSDATPTAGDWDGLSFGTHDFGSTIDGATLSYAGNNGYGGIYAHGNAAHGVGLVVTDSTISHSRYSGVYVASSGVAQISGSRVASNTLYGVYLDASSSLTTTGADATFANNVVTGNGDEPVRLPGLEVARLDDSSTYTGNGTDRIYVGTDTLDADAEWQDLGVDYYVSGDIAVQGSDGPLLTIDPGVTVTFARNAGITAGQSQAGSLRAVGTATAPVVFTSAQPTPAAGDWDGLTIQTYDEGSTLMYATVAYGGGNGYGNLYFYSASSADAVDQCTVSYSSTWGIYRNASTPTIGTVTYTGNTSGTVY